MNLPTNSEIIAFLNNLFQANTDFKFKYNDSFFDKISDAQNPKITIVKCSDSRVQIESFYKTPQNEVFIIRNIGNQLLNNEGSVDFGIEVLKTPLLLIVGHSDCGAVNAVLNKVKTNIPSIDKELSCLKIASNNIKDAVVDNVSMQVGYAMDKYSAKVLANELTIIGAIYDFKNDYGFGTGRIILHSVNGIKDSNLITKTYSDKLSKFNFLKN
jgi:carbonic anhydrase